MKRTLERQSSTGFTLVEMLVALTLLSIFLATVYGFFLSGFEVWLRSRDKAEVEENLRLGINRVTRELRQARYFPFDPDKPLNRAPVGLLKFVNSDGDTVSYKCSPSGDPEQAYQLIRTKSGGGNNPVARYIKEISVDPPDYTWDTSMVTVTLVGEKGKSGEVILSTTVMLRTGD